MLTTCISLRRPCACQFSDIVSPVWSYLKKKLGFWITKGLRPPKRHTFRVYSLSCSFFLVCSKTSSCRLCAGYQFLTLALPAVALCHQVCGDVYNCSFGTFRYLQKKTVAFVCLETPMHLQMYSMQQQISAKFHPARSTFARISAKKCFRFDSGHPVYSGHGYEYDICRLFCNLTFSTM